MTMPMATTIKLTIIIIIVTESTDLEIERISACQCGQGLRRLLYLQQGRQLGGSCKAPASLLHIHRMTGGLQAQQYPLQLMQLKA